MNNFELGNIFRGHGYQWPTERGPRTSLLGRWDHFLLRGFGAAVVSAAASAGRP